MVYLQNMYAQQNEQQNHADHARWERKRKKLFDNLRNPANRKDNSYLCYDFQVLNSSFDPVLPLKAGSAAYLLSSVPPAKAGLQSFSPLHLSLIHI